MLDYWEQVKTFFAGFDWRILLDGYIPAVLVLVIAGVWGMEKGLLKAVYYSAALLLSGFLTDVLCDFFPALGETWWLKLLIYLALLKVLLTAGDWLGIVDRIPVVNLVNRLLGGAFGVLTGITALYYGRMLIPALTSYIKLPEFVYIIGNQITWENVKGAVEAYAHGSR